MRSFHLVLKFCWCFFYCCFANPIFWLTQLLEQKLILALHERFGCMEITALHLPAVGSVSNSQHFPSIIDWDITLTTKEVIIWGNDAICLLVSLKYPWWCQQKTLRWRWQWNAPRKHGRPIGNGVFRSSCKWKYNINNYLGVTPQKVFLKTQSTMQQKQAKNRCKQHGEPCSDLQKIHLRFRIYRNSTNADNKDPRVGKGVSHDGSHTP